MSKMSYYDMNKCLCKELCCEFEKFEEDKNCEILKGIKDLLESMVYLNELEAAGAMRQYFEDEHGYDSRTSEFRETAYPRYGIYNNAPTYTNPNPMYRGDMDGMRDNGTRRKMDGREYGRGYDDNDRNGMRDMNRDRDMRGVYNMAHMDGMKKKEKMDDKEYDEWLRDMVSADGSQGPMWDESETSAVAKKIGIDFKKFTPKEFQVAMDMVYSDYCEIFDKYGMDKPEVYAEVAKAWLEDDDTIKGGKKLTAYYQNVVEPEK